MQKNVIRVSGSLVEGLCGALAVAALAIPAPACAGSENVILYGQANVSYDMLSTGTSAGTISKGGTSSYRVSSNSSRLGLKGSHQLGDDWSALWQMEATVGTDTGAAGAAPTSTSTTTAVGAPVTYTTTTTTSAAQLFDRDTYLGVSHPGKGTLLLGRHDTPYKMSTRRLDVFADGIADNRSLMGTMIIGGASREVSPGVYSNTVVTETFDVRLSDMIAYLSPNLGSFSGAIAYANLAEGNTNASEASVSALSLAGMYEQDQVYATFAYEVHTTTLKETTTAVKAAKLGIGYAMDTLNLGFAYEKSSDELGNVAAVTAANPCGGMTAGANCSGHSTLYLSGKLNLTATDALKVAYSKAGQVGTAGIASGAIQFSMGVDHDINARTTVYILYTILKNDKLVHYGLSSAASSGVNSVNATGAGGASPSAFSFGVKHAF